MATLSTHVLDTATGRPAPGITVTVEKDSNVIARGVTDADGRIASLGESLEPGRYRLAFELDGHFFRRVALDIEIGSDPKYHVPLLMTPFGLTSYRGS